MKDIEKISYEEASFKKDVTASERTLEGDLKTDSDITYPEKVAITFLVVRRIKVTPSVNTGTGGIVQEVIQKGKVS